MTDKHKKHLHTFVKFANIMFGLGILISIIIISYVLYKLFNLPQFASPIFYLVLIFSCFVFILFLGFGLKKFSESLKISLSKFFLLFLSLPMDQKFI